MKLYKASLPVQEFSNLGKQDRAAIVVLANAYNELVCLHKMAAWLKHSSNVPDDEFGRMERLGRACQTYFLLRVLVGKIHEISNLLQRKGSVKNYVNELPSEMREYCAKFLKTVSRNKPLGR